MQQRDADHTLLNLFVFDIYVYCRCRMKKTLKTAINWLRYSILWRKQWCRKYRITRDCILGTSLLRLLLQYWWSRLSMHLLCFCWMQNVHRICQNVCRVFCKRAALYWLFFEVGAQTHKMSDVKFTLLHKIPQSYERVNMQARWTNDIMIFWHNEWWHSTTQLCS